MIRCNRPRAYGLLAALALLSLACGRPRAPLAVADASSRRSPPAGEVIGSTGTSGAHVWRGIPYAQAPVGELRWRAPRPLPRWSGTREALTAGSICTQAASAFGGDQSAPDGTPVGAEDCLYLDLYAPHFEPTRVPTGDARLPVMLWIHGGGNVVGSGSFYDGGRFATTHDVVVAALNYRLGPLGFFRHESLRAQGGSPEDASGNYALLDQIRALQWLRENVAAFGGDPDDITIFGESAGARDVLALLVSPLARGLFQRAVVQSGGTTTTEPLKGEALADASPPGDRNSSNEVLLRLFEADGAAGREGALVQLAAMTPREVADYLRGKTGYELLSAYEPDRYESLPDVPQMFGDGVVLPAGPLAELLARPGVAAKVPVVLGTNRDEFRVFLFMNPNYGHYFLGLIPVLRDEERFLVTAEHLSNWWKATAADELAAALVRSGNAATFVYRFDWDEEPKTLVADTSLLIGASHGFEIPFVFGHWDLGKAANALFTDDNQAGREELAAAMMSYWAQFARTGDPARGTSGTLPEWKAWDNRPMTEKFLRLDTQAGGGIQMVGGTVTREGVLRSIESDARLPTRRQKCGVYWELARWGRSFDEGDYQRAGCAEYPLDTFPAG